MRKSDVARMDRLMTWAVKDIFLVTRKSELGLYTKEESEHETERLNSIKDAIERANQAIKAILDIKQLREARAKMAPVAGAFDLVLDDIADEVVEELLVERLRVALDELEIYLQDSEVPEDAAVPMLLI